MGTFNKTINGLIYKTNFSSLSDFTSNAKISSLSELTFISFGYLPYMLKAGAISRQASIFQDGSTWYLFYDSAVLQWATDIGDVDYVDSGYAVSTDRGLTWSFKGTLGPGDDNGAGGATAHGYAMGWVAKYDSVYYLYRVLLDGTAGGPPYNGDIWSASSMDGPWTFEYTIPKTGATNTAAENLPGSIIKEGSTYHLFIQGALTTGDYKILRMSGSNPDGPFTLDNTVIFAYNFITGEWPENEKVFKYGSNFVMLFNSYESARARRNYVAISSAVDNWGSKTWKRIHTECPADNQTNLGNGVITHVYDQNNNVVLGQNGFFVAVYDGDGGQNNPTRSDYAWYRTIKTCLMEPSTHALRYVGTDSSLNIVYKTLTNTNFIAEFTVEFLTSVTSTGMSFWFRNDGTLLNGYRATFRNDNQTVLLEKGVAGVFTTVATGSGSQRCDLNMANRCKVIASGTSIKVYLNGELQIDATDAAFSTGTHIAFDGQGNVTADVRAFSMRTSNTVTFTGLQPGVNTILRSDGKIPVGQQYANSSGQVQFTLDHWPMECLEVDGDGDNIPLDGIYGGDTIEFSGFSTSAKYKSINNIIR